MSIPLLDPSPPPAGQNLTPRPRSTLIADYAVRMRSPRNVLFLLLATVSFIIFWTPLRSLLHYSLWGDNQYDKYSYTMAIPLISVAIVLLERSKIFASVQYRVLEGAILLFTGVALSWIARRAPVQLGADNSLSIEILALVIFWLAGFILCYGTRAFRVGAFPLLFLLLTAPVPDWLLDKPITAVQHGSAEVSSLIFSLVGVPVLRNELQFFLPGNAIEVAKECSGIHSTLAIVIVSLIAGHLFLPSVWKKAVLVLIALPIVCFTNGLRIASLTLLAEYVDPSFLHGNLHRRGGTGFFLLALLLLFAIVQLLRREQGRVGLDEDSLPSGGHASAPADK
jgi:exosortase